MQQNSKCRWCSDRDEIINHIISKCCKLAQKEYKSRHDRVYKVIHWELCKKLKFHHINKWYTYNLESIPENEMQKILRDFAIQTDHLISARWPDLGIVNQKKRTGRIVDFNILAVHTVKRKICTKTLQENWKNYRTWKWQWYQLSLVHLEQSPKNW